MDPIYLEVTNPATPASRLAELAQLAPHYGQYIAVHPNAYPQLIEWLRNYGDDATRAALAQNAATPLPAPSAVSPVSSNNVFAAGAYSQPQAPQDPWQQPQWQQSPIPQATAHPPARRKKWPIVAGIAAAVLLVGGGAAWGVTALLGRDAGGAGNPEAAVANLTGNIANLDTLRAASNLAPSELSLYTAFSDSEFGFSASDAQRLEEAQQRIAAVTDISVADVETTTDVIAPDAVAKVIIEAGTVTIDVTDIDEYVDASGDIIDVLIDAYPQLDPYGDMQEDVEDQLRAELEAELPLSVDFADFADENSFAFSVMTVKEGSGWYVSPLLTGSELLFDAQAANGYPLKRGTLLSDDAIARHATPEDALAGTMQASIDAFSEGDYEELAATLPLAERRWFSLYGIPLLEEYYTPDSRYEVSLEDSGATVLDTSGNQARLLPDGLTIEVLRTSTGELTTLMFDGLCITGTDADGIAQGACLDYPDPASAQLGIDQIRLTAVQENGVWFISPFATITDIASTLTTKMSALADSGELDDVLTAYGQEFAEQLQR